MKNNYDGTIVIYNYRKQRIDLIKYKQEDIEKYDFVGYIMDLGYDLDDINYFITDEVAVKMFETEDIYDLKLKETIYY